MAGFKNGSKGRRVPKSSLLHAREIWAEGNVNALAVFKACTGVCLLWDWRARQSGWVVAVRYALSTSPALLPPVTRRPSACRSLLSLLLAPFAPSPQASPIIPEMAPCNFRADLPMVACITYELPGSLFNLVYDEGVSAISLQRVELPTVSKVAATAELHYRRGRVGMLCD
jgi:hypothetical protein